MPAGTLWGLFTLKHKCSFDGHLLEKQFLSKKIYKILFFARTFASLYFHEITHSLFRISKIHFSVALSNLTMKKNILSSTTGQNFRIDVFVRCLCLSMLSVVLLCGIPVGLCAQCPVTVDAGNDKYVCQPFSPVQLNGSLSGSYLSYQWMPAQGLSSSTALSPTASVATTTTYTLKARAVTGTNLIPNGDFEQGNTGFTSGYLYSPGNLWAEGTYDVVSNPQSVHANFNPCPGHGGSGQMMVVNGAGTPGIDVWCTSVPVTPNTEYVFSVWGASVLPTSPAILQFSINNSLLGSSFTLPGTSCVWRQFFATWNSGSSSSADICLVNQNTILSGNDFAIDDILFSEVCTEMDEVTVNVINVQALATGATMPCANATVGISGFGSSEGSNITYNWSTVNGRIVSGGNTLWPDVDRPGTYTLTVTYNDGNVTCTKTASTTVTISPTPPGASIFAPLEINCRNRQATLSAVSNNMPPPYTYRWSTNTGTIQGPTNEADCIAIAAGQYFVTVTSTTTGCTAVAQAALIANTAPPIVRATGGLLSCQNPTAILSGTGSSTGTGFTYLWSTSNGTLAGPANALNTSAGAAGTYTLLVSNQNSGCTAVATTTVSSNFAPSTVSISPHGYINCRDSAVTLNTSISPANATLRWSASNGGSIQGSVTSPTVVAGTAGTYSVISTHPVSGCKDTAAVAVAANTVRPVVQIATPGILNCTQTSVLVTGTTSVTSPHYRYQWTATGGGNIVGARDTLRVLVNSVGTYALVVTDTSNHCTATKSIAVMQDTTTVPVTALSKDTLTCVRLSTDLTALHAPAPQGVTYIWRDSSGVVTGTQAAVAVQLPGLYTLILRNTATGCTSTAVARVMQNTNPPLPTIVPPVVLNCATDTVALLVQTQPTGQAFAYQWSGPAGGIANGNRTATTQATAAGQYQVVVTRLLNGCTAAATVQLMQDTVRPKFVVAPPDTLTCLVQQVTLNGTASVAGNNLAYLWSTANGQLTGPVNTPNAVVAKPGVYQVLVTNTQNFCTNSASIQVLANTKPPLVEAGASDTLDCRSLTLTLRGSASTLGAGRYSWTGPGIVSGQQTLQPIVSQGGSYILSVTDPANGCSARDTVQVLDNGEAPGVSIALPDTLTCAVSSVLLSAIITSRSSALRLQWQAVQGALSGGANAPQATAIQPGNYQITVLDTLNGCGTTQSVEVTANTTPPRISIAPPAVLNCAVTHTLLTAAATTPAGIALQYQWSTPNGNISSGASTATPRIEKSGQYQVVATDPRNSCTALATVQVQTDTLHPKVTIAQPGVLTCATTQISVEALTAAAATPRYVWTTANGHFTSGHTDSVLAVDKPGDYMVIVTNEQNHCTDSASVHVLEDKTPPIAKAGAQDTLNCQKTEIVLQGTATPSGVSGIRWDGPGILNGQNSLSPTVTKPGAYVLSVIHPNNGCPDKDTVWIAENKISPVLSVTRPDTLTCSVQQVALTAHVPGQNAMLQGGWTPLSGSIASGQNTLNATVETPGFYLVRVTDRSNGCSAADSVRVLENKTPPLISIAPPDTLTCARPSVALSGIIAGQNAAFQVVWQTSDGRLVAGQTSPVATADRPGRYELHVTDSRNGCASSVETVVVQNAAFPLAEAGPALILTCALPELLLQGTTEQGPAIRIQWTTINGRIVSGANTPAPGVDAPGVYTLSVSNVATGCTSTASVVIGEDKVPPLVQAGNNDTLKCSVNALLLPATVSGGSASDFEYLWTTASGNFTNDPMQLQPTVNAPGLYVLTVRNRTNGCSATDAVEIFRDARAPLSEAGQAPDLTCTRRQVILQGTVAVGPTISYLWRTTNGQILSGAGTLQPVVTAAGVYQLEVMNTGNGCHSVSSVSVKEDTIRPVAEAGVTQTLTCERTSLSLQGSAAAPAHPGVSVQVLWSSVGGIVASGAGTLAPVISAPGRYLLHITDPANGCQNTDSVEVQSDILPPVLAIAPPQVLTCAIGQVQLSATAEVPVSGAFTAQWVALPGAHIVSGANGLSPVIDKSGSYRLTVRGTANGCTASALAEVTENKVLPLAHAGAPVVLTCTSPVSALNGSASSQGSAYQYKWAGPQLVSSDTTLTPSVAAPGIYTLVVRDRLNGCTAGAQVAVRVDKEAPQPRIQQPLVLTCTRDSVRLNGSASTSGTLALWTTADGRIRQGGATLNPVVDRAGTYILRIENVQNGCMATADVSVLEDKAAPGAFIAPVAPLSCKTPVAALRGNSASARPVSYTWTALSGSGLSAVPGQPHASARQPGTYQLLVTNPANGCTSVAIATVPLLQGPHFEMDIDQPDCHAPTGNISLTALGGDAAPFGYALNGGAFQTKTAFQNLAPGAYTVQMRDTLGCLFTRTVLLKTPLTPAVQIPKIKTLDLGDEVQLVPVVNLPNSSIAEWAWSPEMHLSCSDCPRPLAQPVQSTQYTLTITDLNGCTAQAGVSLEVSKDRHVWAPNIFSPNGDGKNDFFTIYGKGVAHIRHLRVFDRWGNQVFLAEEIPANVDAAGWDGTFRGNLLTPAVFVWVAEVFFLDGERRTLSGDVTIWE